MLKKVSVTNFKNFKTKTIFILDEPANYEFNDDIVKDGCITKGIVYGINGSGKSNLALAVFDIVLHLTDKEKSYDRYSLYLNLDSNKPIAEFEYQFRFNGIDVVYSYGKKDAITLTYESLTIGDKEVLSYDFSRNEGYTTLEGAELLQLSSTFTMEVDRLSRVKYINNNAILKDNAENRAFKSFTTFVENMLMFYSLDEKRYQGFSVGRDSYTQGIIRENKVQEFASFLREQGVDYKLNVVDINGVSELYCRFAKDMVPFVSVASTGTRSLALFYYWYIRMSKASLVFIDEYDAFYHFELSQEIVKLVKKLKDTQVFLTTHNTDLISNELLRPDAYFLIKENHIKSFDKITSKELRRAHNIQKMYKAGSFNE